MSSRALNHQQFERTDLEGEAGNTQHITRTERGAVPISALKDVPGARGEVPGQHANYQGERWERFKSAVANGEGGAARPIFITVDPGVGPRISEGNHRRDAHVELGISHVPAEIRYFGHAEHQYGGWHGH